MMSQAAATLLGITNAFVPAQGQTTRLGAGPRTQEPNTKIFATPQGNIRPALPFPSEQERVGSAQLHPTSTCRASSLRAPPSPGQPPGVAVVSTGAGSRCHHHPGPGHHTACKCTPCTASMVSGLDKFLPSEGFVHHR